MKRLAVRIWTERVGGDDEAHGMYQTLSSFRTVQRLSYFSITSLSVSRGLQHGFLFAAARSMSPTHGCSFPTVRLIDTVYCLSVCPLGHWNLFVSAYRLLNLKGGVS